MGSTPIGTTIFYILISMCTCIDINELQLIEDGSQPDFNLDNEFAEANRKYFKGMLKKIPMEYKHLTGKLGLVKAKVRRDSSKRIVKAFPVVLQMTDQFNYTREQFLSTFLHELCHLFMLQDAGKYSWSGGYHGREWQKLADTVSKKSGVPITKDEHTGKYDTKDLPSPVVAFAKFSGGHISIAYTTKSIWSRRDDEYIDWLTATAKGKQWVVFTTRDGRITNFAAKSIKRPTFYKIDQDIVTDMMKNKSEEVILTNNHV